MLLLALAIQASAFTYKEGRSTLGPYPTDRRCAHVSRLADTCFRKSRVASWLALPGRQLFHAVDEAALLIVPTR